MTTRDEIRAAIASLRDRIADAKSRGNQVLADKLKLDLEIEKDSLQLLNEEQADLDEPLQTGDKVMDYLRAKRRV